MTDLFEITDDEIRAKLQEVMPAVDTGWPDGEAYALDQLVPVIRELLDRPRPGYTYRCRVAEWDDADSGNFHIDLGLRHWAHDEPLRLRGVNAPDRKPAKGMATAFMRDLAPVDTELIVRTHRDEREKYGRLLADLWLPGRDGRPAVSLNDALIDAGHGHVYLGGKRPEDY